MRDFIVPVLVALTIAVVTGTVPRLWRGDRAATGAAATATAVESSLAALKARADAQDRDLASLGARLEQAEAKADAADRRADDAETLVRRLRRRVEQLTDVLRDHDIPVPDED